MQKPKYMFLCPLFNSNLVLFKLSLVSRCPSYWDKENERGLDIISIEMSLPDAPFKAQLQCSSSHCTTFSTCKWQCHQMLSFHQSSRGGHEYTKGEAETACLLQLYLAQLYRLGFRLGASTFCFSLKGIYQASSGPNQGRSCILDFSSGLRMQVKCGHQMSSSFYITTARGQRQQGSVLHPASCTHSATSHEPRSSSLPKHKTSTLVCCSSLFFSLYSSLLGPFFTLAVRS